jgi:serine phosphatase RsbU (regulator of sigma subunit)
VVCASNLFYKKYHKEKHKLYYIVAGKEVGPEINADKSEYIFTSQECMTN